MVRDMPKVSFKPKPCAECGSIWHSKGYHKPRRGFIKRPKPLKPESSKTKAKRLKTRREWFKLNPGPTWMCYLQISPDCPVFLTEQTLDLEHELSKVRRPDLKFEVNNIKSSCQPCNKLKGSLSADEIRAKINGFHDTDKL